jgi:hypothetical protein
MSLIGKWSISRNEENYYGLFETLEEAIEEGIQYGTFWAGQCVAPIAPEQLFDGNVLRDWIDQHVLEHDDYAGEWADGAVDASREELNELAEELRPLIAAWLDRHALRPTHWNIDPQSVRYFDAEVGYSIMS